MWDESAQTMPVDQLRALQLKRLQRQVARLHERVPFYRQRMDAVGVAPADIRSLDDLRLLPTMSKHDLRETYPWGLLAVDRSEIVETHMSSGTTGKPVVDAYTAGDLELWSDLMARVYDMGGVTREDVVQVSFGYGLFTGGLGAHYGARRLGATVIPMSSGNTRRQIETIQDFGTSVLACTPSYALYIAEWARLHGIDPQSLGLEAGFFGAEPWSEAMRGQIQQEFGLRAFDIYGLTELIGPGVGAECCEQNGLHIFDDHFYPELLDPDTEEPVAAGEKGELVLTALTREGTPVMRYRTHDITYFIDEPCPCGRTSRRIHRLLGRSDDMLIIKGVNVFPRQVEDVLLTVQGVEPHYQLVVRRTGTTDTLEVRVEMTDTMFSDELGAILALEHRIEAELRASLGIQAKVSLVNPRMIDRSEGKAKRIIDLREVTTHV